jgi:hypothetical protein
VARIDGTYALVERDSLLPLSGFLEQRGTIERRRDVCRIDVERALIQGNGRQ